MGKMRHLGLKSAQVVLLTTALLTPRVAKGAPTCEWVPTTGEAVSEHVSAAEAQNLAILDAYIRAVERVAGVQIKSEALVRNAMLAGHFLRAFADGYVIDREVIRWESVSLQERPDRPPVTVYRVELRACVLRQATSRDSSFRVDATLNTQSFRSGDGAELKVRCARACHVSIFSLADGERSALLLSGRSLAADEELLFPPRGRPLEVYIVPGRVRDAEAFLVVASKRPFDPAATLRRSVGLTVDQILRTVGGVPNDERAETLLVYEVRAP